MECFNDLLIKLRDVHEREVEGWQVKVQELSNKKGCDTKRMEELFTRNQQMKEQHRLLTENIKTLENRLRAGLCDRCTVTQEVANRRQQEFETSQIQSLQHISRLVGEMNNLRKENRRLKDKIRGFAAAFDHSDHSSNSSTITEAKPNSSPDFSASSGPEAIVTVASSRAINQPSDCDVGVKTERNQRTEEAEHRHLRAMSRNHFESYKPLSLSTHASPPWKTEHGIAHVGERRSQSIEGLDQRSSVPPQALFLKNPSSSIGEVNLSRHVLHTPVPCRPQPFKSNPISLPWPLSESSDWVTVAAAGTSQLRHPSPKPNVPHFPNLIPTDQHASPRRQVLGSPWPKHCTPESPAKEPTVLFRFKNLPELMGSQTKPQEKNETLLTNTESVSREGLKDMVEGPLDLSDHGKSKSSQTPRGDSPVATQGGERALISTDNTLTNTPAHILLSSPTPVCLPSSSSSPPVKQEEEPASVHDHEQVIKNHEPKEEVNEKTDQGNEKKVPVLTLSLRPVVVLETLNSALQKQESLSSNGNSSSPAAERECNSDKQDETSSQGCKRKRASVETETARDSDTENIQHAKEMRRRAPAKEDITGDLT